MTPEMWDKVRQVLEQTRALPPEQRAGFVDRLRAADAEVFAEAAPFLAGLVNSARPAVEQLPTEPGLAGAGLPDNFSQIPSTISHTPPPPRPRPARPADPAVEARLGELLAQWEALRAQGQEVSAEALCGENGCPELAELLRPRLEEAEAALGGREPPTVAGKDRVTEPNDIWSVQPARLTDVTASAVYNDMSYHARGGLGEIHRAKDTRLRREVAVKLLSAQALEQPNRRNRFLLEAEVTGQLDHPGIVPIYGIGESADGRPFYAMRFVRGTTLETAINSYHQIDWVEVGREEGRGQFRRLLRHFISACQTVAYAHNRGVLHCDIKPQNIMLGKWGETLVMDWGEAVPFRRDGSVEVSEGTLPAARFADDPRSSLSSSGGGTLIYMSPERVAYPPEPVTPASDVYSLGVTLYKLLTGRNAFAGEGVKQIADLISAGKYPPVRAADPRIPAALAAVCEKAMALRTGDRYATPEDLAADLERWLADEPVQAHREPALERGYRWLRRHRGWTLGIVGAVLFLLTVSGFVTFLKWREAGHQRALRQRATEAARQNVQLAAKFAARSVEFESGLRWEILERVAADARLVELLGKLDAEMAGVKKLPVGEAFSPTQEQLGAWLKTARDFNQQFKGYAWWVIDRRGYMAAIQPEDEYVSVLNANFRYRDYFHGQGQDLPPDEAPEDLKPIDRPHVSNAFPGKVAGDLLVVFSVPVLQPAPPGQRPTVLGVLAMSVRMAEFNVLNIAEGKGTTRVVALINTRPESVQEGEKKLAAPRAGGLVLQHPYLVRMRFDEPDAPPEKFKFYADPGLVKDLKEFGSRRERQERMLLKDPTLSSKEGFTTRLFVDEDYRDPVGGDYGGPWLAVFEPVLLRDHRHREVVNTGWVVAVQERIADPGAE